MPTALTTIERAFELAREGACSSMDDIRKALKQERWDGVEAQLAGPSLRIQLRTLMMEARLRRFGRKTDGAS